MLIHIPSLSKGAAPMAMQKAAEVATIRPGTGKVVQVGGKTLALFNLGGTFLAIDNACTHVGGPLGEGHVNGDVVTCPWHGSRFEIKTGKVVGPPATRNVATYPTRIQDGAVFVDVP